MFQEQCEHRVTTGDDVPKIFEYQTLATAAEAQFKRKNSRFIGLAFPVSGHEATQTKLGEVKARFPDATHHCTAYRLLQEGHVKAHSDDDGEPLNSAGPPMLQVINGRNLLNVLVVTVRYFGGTKLGVGGLIRAYGDAAKAALDEAQIVNKIPQAHLKVRYPNAMTGAVMSVLHRSNVEIRSVSFEQSPEAHITLPLAQRDGLERQLQEACAGRAKVLDD